MEKEWPKKLATGNSHWAKSEAAATLKPSAATRQYGGGVRGGSEG